MGHRTARTMSRLVPSILIGLLPIWCVGPPAAKGETYATAGAMAAITCTHYVAPDGSDASPGTETPAATGP